MPRLQRRRRHARHRLPVVTSNVARVLHLFQLDASLYRVTPSEERAGIELSGARASIKSDVVVEGMAAQKAVENGKTPSGMRSMRVMSLFSGAGGIDIGLGYTGTFKTQWAIDSCRDACQTFRQHHPDVHKTRVINADIGDVLVARSKASIYLPKPRDKQVDVIVMGPPCQPFSGLNRTFRKKHDGRSLLVATGMSFVDVYRPSYGILENVKGILKRGDLGTVKGEGTIKFVRACLLALGYQCRISVTNSADHGVPQDLQSVIVIFAQNGLSLPSFPSGRKRVTIQDATSDLPRWEYRNPHLRYNPEASLPDTRPLHLRPEKFDVKRCAEKLIGPRQSSYTQEPSNDFQRQVRAKLTLQDKVQQHRTVYLDNLCIERICNVPFVAGANHLHWHGGREGLLHGLDETLEDAAFDRAFGRLSMDGKYPAIVTHIDLAGKTGNLLMPDQNRIPTIRELARAQGFPDAVFFHGTPTKILEQLGNTVPPPLTKALGESIKQAAILDWQRGERRFARTRS